MNERTNDIALWCPSFTHHVGDYIATCMG